MFGWSIGLPWRAHSVAPPPLQRHTGEHRGLARAGRGRAGGLFLIGRVPEPAQDVDAPHLDVGGSRVLVLVDHVLVERQRHELAGLRLHPGRHEGREVEARVAVEHELVGDHLGRRFGLDRVRGQLQMREVAGRTGPAKIGDVAPVSGRRLLFACLPCSPTIVLSLRRRFLDTIHFRMRTFGKEQHCSDQEADRADERADVGEPQARRLTRRG